MTHSNTIIDITFNELPEDKELNRGIISSESLLMRVVMISPARYRLLVDSLSRQEENVALPIQRVQDIDSASLHRQRD